MTSKIEKQFYETFRIKKKEYVQCLSIGCKHPNKDCKDCEFHDVRKTDYPRMTDRMLLELICLSSIYLWGIHPKTVNELKDVLLEKYIEYVNLMANENEKQEYIHQVQKLFKENN